MRKLSLLLAVAISFASCSAGDTSFRAYPAPPAGAHQDAQCVNLNLATLEQLEALPGVGEATALKIIEHRSRNGPFRRAAEVIIVDGFSERKYREIADRVCVD